MDMRYSLDKLMMYLKVDAIKFKKLERKICGDYGNRYGNIKSQRDSNRISDFHYNYVFETASGESYYLGVQPNFEPPNSYYTYVKLEFNPAKVGNSIEFNSLHSELLYMAEYYEFKRFDVAIDFPVLRENCFLMKDQRMYKLFQNSNSNKTEYLGQRTNHGHVKLYNKQIEAKLNYPLTRLEITLDYENCTYREFKRLFPEVYVIEDLQSCFDDMSLNGTDRVLLKACMEHPEYVKELERKMRKKIECILQKYTQTLYADEVCYKSILADIMEYGKSYIEPKFEILEDTKTPFDGQPKEFNPVQLNFN